jgi:hypothetical protein
MNVEFSGSGFPAGMVLIFIGVAALIIVGAVYSWRQAKKRREELAAWAAKSGLTYSEGRDTSYEYTFPEFRQLKAGEGDRYAQNIVSGTFRNRELRAFDYHYITTSTDDKGNTTTQHHTFSALIMGCEVPLKPLNIRPEGFFDRIGAAFGFEDINFESAEFSRKYKVTAPDRKWAYDVLHARVIEYLLPLPPFSMQFGCGNLVMFWTSGAWNAGQFESSANIVAGFLDLLPDYVKKQQQGAVA